MKKLANVSVLFVVVPTKPHTRAQIEELEYRDYEEILFKLQFGRSTLRVRAGEKGRKEEAGRRHSANNLTRFPRAFCHP